ncbi:MAG: YraN family protein [Desulfarculaceae bacterium]|nr:YraN family protein [Desulfarculaceae bacterium]
MPSRAQLKGRKGEEEACAFLAGRGLRVLEKNYMIPGAEIDIIARDGDSVVFVEVKRRSSLKKGRPAESVTPAKQRKIVMAAMHYLKKKKLHDLRARFDVVEIVKLDGQTDIRQIENAFGAELQ